MKGFKAFNPDMTCQGFKFEVGIEYKETKLEMCASGFHFCENALDVYNYYPKRADTIICEVEALGIIQEKDDKRVTNHIKIIRRLTDSELLEIWINKNNSGDYNSGNGNSGDCNSGDYNSGNGNSGNGNSGHCNSGNYNSGFFNTNSPTVRLFNRDSGLPYTDSRIYRLMELHITPILQWVDAYGMTDEEKTNNPSYKTTNGYLKNTGRNDYSSLTKKDVELIKSLPGFDDEIFKQITGISIESIKNDDK